MSNQYNKVKHYQSKIVESHAQLDSEVIVLELFIAFLAGVFAFIGYKAKILFLLIFCAFIFLIALLSSLHLIYSYIKKKRDNLVN